MLSPREVITELESVRPILIPEPTKSDLTQDELLKLSGLRSVYSNIAFDFFLSERAPDQSSGGS